MIEMKRTEVEANNVRRREEKKMSVGPAGLKEGNGFNRGFKAEAEVKTQKTRRE